MTTVSVKIRRVPIMGIRHESSQPEGCYPDGPPPEVLRLGAQGPSVVGTVRKDQSDPSRPLHRVRLRRHGGAGYR